MRIASISQAGGPVVGIQIGEQWIDFSAALQTYRLVTTRVQEPLITTTYELLRRACSQHRRSKRSPTFSIDTPWPMRSRSRTLSSCWPR